MVPSDTEEDNAEDGASSASTSQPGQETPTVAKTPSPVNNGLRADSEAGSALRAGKPFQSTWLEYDLTVFITVQFQR